jgi:hypothetical protein
MRLQHAKHTIFMLTASMCDQLLEDASCALLAEASENKTAEAAR